jgi:hypothetical protein
MLNVDNIYPVSSSYICESVYSEPQQASFLSVLKSSFDLLVELCKNLPNQVKQIVYLAEDIIEMAKAIPSSVDKNKVIDMRNQICDVVHEIAKNAPKVEIGLPVNIDSQVMAIREHQGN